MALQSFKAMRQEAYDKNADGIVDQATEDELTDAAARADRTGMYCCPHTGVALAVLFKMIARGEVKKSDRVIVISTAHGLKFTDFKVDYHSRKLSEVVSRYANPPLELPADTRMVKDAIARELDRRTL